MPIVHTYKFSHGTHTTYHLACRKLYSHRYPRPRVPPHVMASSALGLKLRVFGFLPITHAKHMQNECVHDFPMQCGVLCVSIFTLRPQYMQVTYAPDKPQLLIMEKPKDPQFEPHVGMKMIWVLGSPLWVQHGSDHHTKDLKGEREKRGKKVRKEELKEKERREKGKEESELNRGRGQKTW